MRKKQISPNKMRHIKFIIYTCTVPLGIGTGDFLKHFLLVFIFNSWHIVTTTGDRTFSRHMC